MTDRRKVKQFLGLTFVRIIDPCNPFYVAYQVNTRKRFSIQLSFKDFGGHDDWVKYGATGRPLRKWW